MGKRKRWLGNGEETQQAELHLWVLLTGGVQRVRNKPETQIQIQTPLTFSLWLFPNTYILSRYAWSFCHLVVVTGIASASTPRTKTLESGRFSGYLADQQGI